MKVAFMTLGCKVNQYDTEILEGLFQQRGYSMVPFEEKADVYVINTCSVTHLGEKKSRQLIRRAKRINQNAVIAVTGCYAQTAPEELEALEVDVLVGNQNRQSLVDLVEEVLQQGGKAQSVSNVKEWHTFEDIPLYARPQRTRAFLKIQEGCNNFCTYCIIPYARGPLKSRPLSGIRREVEKFVEAGFKEIVFTGIHLGAYGRDLGTVTLTDAVKEALAVPGLVRLRLGSLESVEVSPELLHLMNEDSRLCAHLHLPLQAGHDETLKSMNRHYGTAEFQIELAQIMATVPDIAISTDLIVGFPGETNEMFEEALRYVKTLPFSRMHIFPYSKRRGTPAAKMPDQVPEDVKRVRVYKMQQVAEQLARDFAEKYIGQELDVLWEADHDGIMEGYSSNYLRLYTKTRIDQISKIETVQATKLYKDGLWI